MEFLLGGWLKFSQGILAGGGGGRQDSVSRDFTPKSLSSWCPKSREVWVWIQTVLFTAYILGNFGSFSQAWCLNCKMEKKKIIAFLQSCCEREMRLCMHQGHGTALSRSLDPMGPVWAKTTCGFSPFGQIPCNSVINQPNPRWLLLRWLIWELFLDWALVPEMWGTHPLIASEPLFSPPALTAVKSV